LGLDITELSFAAASPSAVTPPLQQVLAYFDNYRGNLRGDVFLQLTLSGPAVLNGTSTVAKVSLDANGNFTGTQGGPVSITNRSPSGFSSIGVGIPIQPVAPAALGAGTFTGTATLRVCLGDSTCSGGDFPGSPRTINITYVVDPVASGTLDKPADVVLPRAQVANRAGSVVIRGQSLSGVTSVRFGNASATRVTVVSDTEVRAQVPALSAGNYAVALNNGAVAFTGSLQVVAPITTTAQVLSYQDTVANRVTAAVYDDARQALLVVLAGSLPVNNKVLRFVRGSAGEWTSTAFSVPNLNDLVLANDGSRYLGVTDTAVVELSLDTLAVQRTVAAPAGLSSVSLQRLALGNDGRAVITTTNDRFLSAALLYSTLNGSFAPLNNAGQLQAGSEPSSLVSTDDGARIFITQSVTGGAVLDYDSSNSVVSERPVSLMQVDDQPLAVDQNVTRVLAYDGLPNTAQVHDGSFAPLSTLSTDEPGVFSADAVVINRAGTRAIALRDNGNFHFFDLTAAPASNGNAVQSDAPLTLNFDGGDVIQTAISADGGVAFFAGQNGVAVVPVTK
jgi:hypothetical protein